VSILFFRSEDDVARWCSRTGKPRGEILSLDQSWSLARAWYGDRLSPDFRGRTAAEAEAIFRGEGLTSAFWRLSLAGEDV
jgi:hypothetical protein